MELNTKTLTFAAIGAVLLIAVLLSRKGGTSIIAAPSIPYFVSGNTADRAQLAEIDATKQVALEQNKTEQLKSVLGFQLGTTQADLGYRLGLQTVNNDLTARTLESNNGVLIAQSQSDAVVKASDNARLAAISEAENARIANVVSSRYAYEAVHQQAKSDRVKSTWSGIGSIVGSVLKFL